MKVLYIGYYKENSEWGKMATNFILSMQAAGIEVVPKAIALSGSRQVGSTIEELEKGNVEDCDICIQHVFPDHFVGSEKFKKNIALFTNDGVEFAHSSVIEKLNQATEVWVTNTDTKNSLENLVNVPVSIVYPGFKEEVYKKKYQDISSQELDDKFKFYTMLNSVEAVEDVLATFHSTFDSSDLARLIIFTTNVDEEFPNKMEQFSMYTKKRLRLKQDPKMYLQESLIQMTEASETDIYALHQYADCYVSANHGDAWPVTAFDAMAFGSTPIVVDYAGASEFPDDACNKIKYSFSVNLAADSQISDTNNGFDYNVKPCHKQMKQVMRKRYDAWLENAVRYSNECAVQGLQAASKFSLQESGKIIKELINVEN